MCEKHDPEECPRCDGEGYMEEQLDVDKFKSVPCDCECHGYCDDDDFVEPDDDVRDDLPSTWEPDGYFDRFLDPPY